MSLRFFILLVVMVSVNREINMRKMSFSNLVPLCFGLLAILLTSLSQAASQYKSIPELIEELNDYSESDGTFKMISKNHFQLSPQVAENDYYIDEYVQRSLIYGIYRTFIHTNLKEITVTVVPVVFLGETKYLDQYTQTISITKKQVETIAKKLFGIDRLDKLVKTRSEGTPDTWNDLFKKGYYNSLGNPTLAVHFRALTNAQKTQRKVPLYNEPITDSASGEKLFNFIEKNFGKTVQLDIKINIKNEGSNQFIEVNFGKESYLLVINKNEECVRDAAEIEANSTDEESMPLVTACGGTEYNFSGKGYEFNKKIDGSYILRGYFKVPEDGGGVHQGIYSIGLEAINK